MQMNTHFHFGKVVYVHEGNRFDVVVDCDFRIWVKVPMTLEGLNLPSFRSSSPGEKQLVRNAKDCAMKLLLHRRVLMETFQANGDGAYSANMFIQEETGYSQCREVIGDRSYINVLKYMRALADVEFDPSKVDVKPLVNF